MTTQTRRLGRLAAGATAGVLALGALLAGCSGSGGSGASDSAAPAAAPANGLKEGGTADFVSGSGSQDAPGGANRTVVEVESKIKTGQVLLTSRHLGAVRDEVDRQLAALGGTVDNEQTEHSRSGAIERSTLVVRVPVARFEAAMDAFERIGRLRSSDTQSENVTQQVIDLRERVQTLENSLERLHKFQSQAADVGELLRYEQEITERESELQSLRAQRDYLADQTAMSTITLTMTLPDKVPPGALDDAGFLAGLRAGWNSLVDTSVVVLTAVGAVIPFAVVLALVGVPVWLWVRRLRRRTPPAEPAAP